LNHLQGAKGQPPGSLPTLRPDAPPAKPNAGKDSAKYGRYMSGSILGKKPRWSFKVIGGYHHSVLQLLTFGSRILNLQNR
jgi:hypothetical protein